MRQRLADLFNLLFGFRNTIVMLLLMTIGIIFRYENFISGSEFVDLVKNTVLGFFAAHGCEHIVGTVNAYYTNKNAADVPDDVVAPTAPVVEHA